MTSTPKEFQGFAHSLPTNNQERRDWQSSDQYEVLLNSKTVEIKTITVTNFKHSSPTSIYRNSES